MSGVGSKADVTCRAVDGISDTTAKSRSRVRSPQPHFRAHTRRTKLMRALLWWSAALPITWP